MLIVNVVGAGGGGGGGAVVTGVGGGGGVGSVGTGGAVDPGRGAAAVLVDVESGGTVEALLGTTGADDDEVDGKVTAAAVVELPAGDVVAVVDDDGAAVVPEETAGPTGTAGSLLGAGSVELGVADGSDPTGTTSEPPLAPMLGTSVDEVASALVGGSDAVEVVSASAWLSHDPTHC